jgi:hypothetical protein
MNATSIGVPAIGARLEAHEGERLLHAGRSEAGTSAGAGMRPSHPDRLSRVDAPGHHRLDRPDPIERHVVVVYGRPDRTPASATTYRLVERAADGANGRPRRYSNVVSSGLT